MNTIVKSYITRLGGHILIKRYLRSRKDHVQMNTIVKSDNIRAVILLIKRYLRSRKDHVQMNTIVKSYITRLGGHILIKRYLRSRKDHVQMNTIVNL